MKTPVSSGTMATFRDISCREDIAFVLTSQSHRTTIVIHNGKYIPFSLGFLKTLKEDIKEGRDEIRGSLSSGCSTYSQGQVDTDGQFCLRKVY
tara:strand:+ start:200 stop:478 length:279 start_codon:yes stop_codon:yes gene_type:complete